MNINFYKKQYFSHKDPCDKPKEWQQKLINNSKWMEHYSTLKESCDANKIDWLGIQNKYNSNGV